MSKLSLDKNNQRALVAAIVASGTDDLNVMFLAFSMSSIISELGKNYIDPVPAALILTAIVIGFAVTCLLISIYIANYKLKGSDNVIELEDVEHIKEVNRNA